MKLVTLDKHPTKEEALEVIESLRRDIESGEMVAFFAIGVSQDDSTNFYCGTTHPVSRLRVIGALALALHAFQSGEVL